MREKARYRSQASGRRVRGPQCLQARTAQPRVEVEPQPADGAEREPVRLEVAEEASRLLGRKCRLLGDLGVVGVDEAHAALLEGGGEHLEE